MVIIKNIIYSDIHFVTDDKNFQKCLSYVKSVSPNYELTLPKNPQQSISFELTGASSALANCIRRYLIDEMPVYSMDVNEDNIYTDDRFILSDHLRDNIELIPFNQNFSDDELKTLHISLNIENKTDDIISVYSRDFLITDNEKKILDNNTYFTTTISIIKLRPGKTLTVKDIGIVSGVGKKNSGKFILLANIYYDILDVKPVVENKYNKTGESSLNSDASHFKLGFTTHRNIIIKTIMPTCCDLIIKNITSIQLELSKIKETDDIYVSDKINLSKNGDIKCFNLNNEYWTISNIISKYCYMECKDIKFVCSSIIHPATEISVVKINHPESIKILLAATANIIKDINTIKKAFK